MIEFNQTLKPDIVFIHTRADIHQDHATVTEEALRAFRGTTVFGFDVIRSSYGFFPNFLVEVCQEDVDLKIKALAEYETYQNKYYFDPEAPERFWFGMGSSPNDPSQKGLRHFGSLAHLIQCRN